MKRLSKIAIVILLGGILMFGFGSCRKKQPETTSEGRYRVITDGYFEGLKSDYRAGEEVVAYSGMIPTDTDYSFYLDDERLNPDFEWTKGYICRFTMPDHDVVLRCEFHNSMMWMPNEGETETGA